MKKRLIACVLALCLLLTALVGVNAQSTPVINFHDDSVMRSMTTVVYGLSEDRYRLMPDVRSIYIMSNETILEVLANEVLLPTQTEELISAMTERVRLYVLSVAQTGRIVTVDLGGDAEMMQPYEIFCLKAAMTNTLIETGMVDYVNVLFDGREITTNDLPTGTMTRFDEDLQSAWIEHENEGVAALRSPDYTFKRNVTLYFKSAETDLLLTEVRQITFTRSNLAIPVLSALISGPMDDTLGRSYPASASVIGIPSLDEEDEFTNFLDINFSYEMGNALAGDTEQRRLRLAPLVLTLTGFLPETDALYIRVNRRPIESLTANDSMQRLLYRQDYTGFVGRMVELYFPDGQGRQLEYTRAVPQKSSALRDLFQQMFIVPEGVAPIFPEGFAEEHLRGIGMVDDTAVVNLTEQGAELFRELSLEEERESIFCLVNTLTSYAGVSRVQFLVEGYKVDALAGALSLRTPLVRNPGVIRVAQVE